MSDLSSASYCEDKRNDNSNNSLFMIILLLCLCQGDNGFLGGGCQNDGCSCGCGGMDGILPIILLLSLCGGGGGCFC